MCGDDKKTYDNNFLYLHRSLHFASFINEQQKGVDPMLKE